MSQMLNQLANYIALDLIGGPENCLFYEVLENLLFTAEKVVSANSKPFKKGKNYLEPTVDYYNFYGSINCFRNNTDNLLWLTNQNENCIIPSHVTLLVRAIQEILNSNRHVHPDALKNYQPSVDSDIHIFYTSIWNSIRGHAVGNEFKLVQKKRKALISKQCQENTRIVGRLLRQYDSLQVFRFNFKINHQADTKIVDINLLDKSTEKVYQKLSAYFRQIGMGQILCIQSRIQRTMTGQCYVNIFVYAQPNTEINFNIDLNQFRDSYEKGPIRFQTFVSDMFSFNTTLFATHNFAFNFEQWKVFFKCALYPLNYYYYESKHIKPSFTSIQL